MSTGITPHDDAPKREAILAAALALFARALRGFRVIATAS